MKEAAIKKIVNLAIETTLTRSNPYVEMVTYIAVATIALLTLSLTVIRIIKMIRSEDKSPNGNKAAKLKDELDKERRDIFENEIHDINNRFDSHVREDTRKFEALQKTVTNGFAEMNKIIISALAKS